MTNDEEAIIFEKDGYSICRQGNNYFSVYDTYGDCISEDIHEFNDARLLLSEYIKGYEVGAVDFLSGLTKDRGALYIPQNYK